MGLEGNVRVSTFQLSVLTPERAVYEGTVEYVEKK
jgi:hypothetical protein